MSRSFWTTRPRPGEKGPVCADAATVFVRLREGIRADRYKPAITDFHFAV